METLFYPNPKVLKADISFLRLPKEVENAFRKYFVPQRDKVQSVKKIKTIEDLICLTEETAKDIIYSVDRYNYNQNLYRVNEALALTGHHFREPDFTFYEISLKKIGVSNLLVEKLKKHNIETIGDYHMYGTRKITSVYGLSYNEAESVRSVIKDFKGSLKNNTTIESADLLLTQFYGELDDFARGKLFELESLENKGAGKNADSDLLKMPISSLNLSHRTSNALSNSPSIKTVQNLVNLGYDGIKGLPKVGANAVEEIVKVLSDLGIELSTEEEKTIITDFSNMTKEKILSLSIEQVDFGTKINNKLAKISNLKTIGDIAKLSKKELLEINKLGPDSVKKIIEKLKELNIELCPDTKNKGKKRTFIKNVFEGLTADEVLAYKLCDCVESSTFLKALESLPEIVTVGDLVNKFNDQTRQDRVLTIKSEYDYNNFVRTLKAFGITIKRSPVFNLTTLSYAIPYDQRHYHKSKSRLGLESTIAGIKNAEDVKLATEDDEIFKTRIEDFGFSEKTIAALKNEASIVNIEDLANFGKSKLKTIYGIGPYALTEIEAKLLQKGIILKGSRILTYGKKKKFVEKPDKKNHTDKKENLSAKPQGKDKDLKVTQIYTKIDFDAEDLIKSLKVDGILAIYKLNCAFFAPDSENLAAIKHIINDYFEDKFRLLETASNDTVRNDIVSEILTQTKAVESVFTTKQQEYFLQNNTSVNTQNTVGELKSNLKKVLNKFHHGKYQNVLFNDIGRVRPHYENRPLDLNNPFEKDFE